MDVDVIEVEIMDPRFIERTKKIFPSTLWRWIWQKILDPTVVTNVGKRRCMNVEYVP